jgi:hypothetical protein
MAAMADKRRRNGEKWYGLLKAEGVSGNHQWREERGRKRKRPEEMKTESERKRRSGVSK